MTSSRRFYLFLSACGGNWRNSIYISGDATGYLLAADRDGSPVVMSINQFQQLAGERIDPAECRGQLTQSAFRDIYAQYLLWKLPTDNTDILAALSCPGQ